MMYKYEEQVIGDLAKVKGGKRLPKGKNLISIPNSHPYIRIRDLGKSKILELTDDYEFVDDATQSTISKYVVEKDDIVISIVGTIGLVGVVGATLHDANLTENCVKLTNISEHVDRGYLYYYLISPMGQVEISKGTVGAVQPKLPIKNIQNIKIVLPPLDVQKKVASILSAIDDKIRVNEAINHNLQQQIQALVSAWFCTFEPFGGAAPDNWSTRNLSDIADFIGGYAYKGNELVESTTAMATIKNFERSGGFKLDGFKEIQPSNKLKTTQHLELYDILVAHTDLTQNAEVIGNAEMVMSLSKYRDAIFSMDLVKVVPKQGGVSRFLLAALLQNRVFKAHCLGYVNGTTVLHLSKKALPEYELLLPDNLSELSPIDEAVTALYLQISANIEEISQLQSLRDTLLPRLMSGEIDVSEVEL